MAHLSAPLPIDFARSPLRTIRPRDAADTYAHPRPEMARLTRRGVLHRAAHGYYVVVPQDQIGQPWLPELEAVTAGIATTIFGEDRVVLMGVSAARLHGAIPRALATGVVAVPTQHRPIVLSDRPAQIRFVQRDTDELDAERIVTPLGSTLVTTVEQTVLDLARRPTLGNAEVDVPAAVATLYRRSDVRRLTRIATEQRLNAAFKRAESWAHEQT